MPKSLNIFVNIGAKVAGSVNASAEAVEARLGKMGRAMKLQAAEMKVQQKAMSSAYKDMAAIFVGTGAFSGLHKMIDASSEYTHQISLLRVAGRSTSEVAQAIAAAHKTMAEVPTATLSDNLKIINETTLAYGGMAHAIENLTFNQRMGAMLKNIMGDSGGDEGKMFADLTKALEIRSGKMSAKDYQRQAAEVFQAISVSGGRVNPENFLGFMQQANPGARAYTEDFMTTVVPSLIQEFGGERAGTLSSAFTMQMMGRVGQGGKRIVENWKKYHLLKPGAGSGDNFSKTGWDPKQVVGLDLALSNQMEYFEKIMIPNLKAGGVDLNDTKQVLIAAQGLFGRQTGARIASTYLDPAQMARLHADQTLYKKALGPDRAFTQAMANDPKMAMASAAASMKNLETTIGNAITPDVAKALNTFARGVNRLAAVVDAHPMLGKAIGGIFAAITAAAVFQLGRAAFGFLGLGSALGFLAKLPLMAIDAAMGIFFTTNAAGGFAAAGGLGAFLAVAWPVVALIAALAAVTYLVVKNWKGIKEFFHGFGKGFKKALSPELLDSMKKMKSALSDLFDAIGKALKPAVDLMKSAFHWLGKLFPSSGGKGKGSKSQWESSGESFGSVIGSMANGLTGLINLLISGTDHATAFFNAMSGKGGKTSIPPAPSGRPAPHRAMGGSVSRGGLYGINERGGEMFVPGRSGAVIPARATAALIAAMTYGLPAAASPAGGLHVGQITVYEAHDAHATAVAVRTELKRLAASQSAYLSD